MLVAGCKADSEPFGKVTGMYLSADLVLARPKPSEAELACWEKELSLKGLKAPILLWVSLESRSTESG